MTFQAYAESKAVSPSPLERVPVPHAGEALSDFFRRAILNDPHFKSLRSSARGFGFDVWVPGKLCPALLSHEVVDAFYQVLERSGLDVRTSSLELIDRLWSPRPDILPLSFRMVDSGIPDLGDLPPKPAPDFVQASALMIAVEAGRFRDGRAADICEALRSGRWQASGFLPGDIARKMVPIESAWWGDTAMECRWTTSTLQPIAPTGQPSFLGLCISPSGVAASPPRGGISTSGLGKPGPKTIGGDRMRAALSALLADGQTFATKTAAHAAVLKHLGIRDRRRGYGIQTFSDCARDLLGQGLEPPP